MYVKILQMDSKLWLVMGSGLTGYLQLKEKKKKKNESRLLPEAVHLLPGKSAGLMRSAKCMKNSQMSQ